MARRAQNRPNRKLLGFLALLFVLLGISALKELPLLATIVIFVVGGALVWKLRRPGQLRRSAIVKTEATIERHIDQLVRKKAQLIRRDDYGKLLSEKWDGEIQYFVTNHIAPVLTPEERSALSNQPGSIHRIVAERVRAAEKNRPAFREFSNEFTGADFEIFCAEQLKASGWDARATPPSRDQGVDVIAERAGVRVVLQCKLYSNPVGNKAVQEIVAARAHVQAHYGAVVTNNGYTSPAKQLASTNGVLLLHHTELPDLDKLIGNLVSSRARL